MATAKRKKRETPLRLDDCGRLSLPLEVRKELHWEPDDIVYLRQDKHGLYILKGENPFDALSEEALHEYKVHELSNFPLILARVEPELKEKAEEIMSKLGISASVVINMLYKQIVMTKSIPFTLSLPADPTARDEMDADTFNAIMQNGLDEAKEDYSRPVFEVFVDLKREL